jgi:hypothetical protein
MGCARLVGDAGLEEATQKLGPWWPPARPRCLYATRSAARQAVWPTRFASVGGPWRFLDSEPQLRVRLCLNPSVVNQDSVSAWVDIGHWEAHRQCQVGLGVHILRDPYHRLATLQEVHVDAPHRAFVAWATLASTRRAVSKQSEVQN